MADEFKLTKTLSYAKGTLKYTYTPGTLNLPQGTAGYVDQIVTCTTAEADVTISLASPGLTLLRNLESTTTGGTINWGLKSSTGGIPLYFKLPPKADAQFSFASSTGILRAAAAAGTVSMQVLTFNN